MRWDAVLHPVGPLPVATYWIRRAIVLAGIVFGLVILGVIVGAVGGGGSHPAKRAGAGIDLVPSEGLIASGSPSGSTSPGVTPGPSTGKAATCADTDLALVIGTGATSYPSGSLPQFTLTVTDTGSAACSRDLGAKAAVITVTSGTDRIWSSGDCPSAKADVRTLSPGVAVKLASSWDRVRSVPGCATTGAAGQTAKIGVYVASVKLGTLVAPATASFHIS